jgi:uncharacterized membrane protein YoaK (UPF0700 family)
MQNTRLSTTVDAVGEQLRRQFRNPWRRLAVMAISLLFGIYLGAVIASTAGQWAEVDAVIAAFAVAVTEAVSWLFYSRRWNFRATLLGEATNALKIGVIYGLFLLSFFLGS